MSSKVKKRTRNRRYTICTQCRLKKVKCTRGHPCERCGRLGLKCEYKAPAGKQMITDQYPVNESVFSLDMGPSKVTAISVRSQSMPASNDFPLEHTNWRAENFGSLQDQVVYLRRELAFLQHGNSHGARPKVLSRKLPELKRTILAMKPSSATYAGPTSRFTLAYARPCLMYVIMATNDLDSMDRHEWKQKHQGSAYTAVRQLIHDRTRTEEDIIDLLNERIVPNRLAIQERLLYFQHNLNHMLYHAFISFEILMSHLLHYFPEGLPFQKPSKSFYYSDVAMLLATTYLTEVYTRGPQAANQMKFKLTFSRHELPLLAIRLLNLAGYKRKVTQQALMTLVLLRSALYDAEAIEGSVSELDSSSLFHHITELSIQIGLHRDLDVKSQCIYKDYQELSERLMSTSQLMTFWNWLLAGDCSSAFVTGAGLSVDLKYCHGFYKEGFRCHGSGWSSAIYRARDVVELMNSRKDISINEVLAQMSLIMAELRELPSSMFLRKSQRHRSIGLVELTHSMMKKLGYLMMYETLGNSVTSVLAHLITNGEDDRLCSLARDNYNSSVLVAMVALLHVTDICNGITGLGAGPDEVGILFLRSQLNQVVSQSVLTLYGMLLSQMATNYGIREQISGSLQEVDYILQDRGIIFSGPEYQGPVTLETIEETLYNNQSGEMQRLVNRLMKPTEINRVASNLYAALERNSCFYDSLDSYITVSSLSGLISLVDSFEKNAGGLVHGQVTVKDVILEVREKRQLSESKPGRATGVNDFSLTPTMFMQMLDGGDLL